MTKKEFEDRLARLGPGPVGSDLGPQVLYLTKKINILTRYLLEQKATSRQGDVEKEQVIEGKKDVEIPK